MDNSHLAPTDLYFYDFNSVWDVNDDGEYSIDREEANTRIDYYPEIYTGRILCTEPKHVENYTKKLIKYESNPGNGDFAYLRRSYFSAYHEMNYTAKKAKGTFEAYDFFDPEESFLREDSQNHNPKGIDVIEDMKRHYGFFSWHGHGNPYIISVGSYNDYDSDGKKNSGIYYISSCDNTTSKEDREYGFTGINRIDNKDYPSIAYSIACITSPFDRYISDNKPYDNIRFCNAFTIEGDYGGPAFLGNTRFGSVSTSHYLEQSFAKFLADTYIVGVAECQSKADSPINDYAKLSHNLIGEPEFKMWSNLPQKFNDISIIFENNELFMEGNNLMKSRIGLTDFNKSYNFIAYYNELQKNNVDIQNPIISIWKNNYLPLILWSPCKQELTECKKKLTLTEAVLGLDKVDNESEFFIIGNNSDLDLNLRDKIVLNPGFRLIGNGQLKIKSGGTVKIKGSEIKDNASLMISAPSAIIDNGFEIGNGAVMQINVLK